MSDKPVWLEEWKAETRRAADVVTPCGVLRAHIDGPTMARTDVAPIAAVLREEEMARLAAAAPALVRMVLHLEHGTDDGLCFDCLHAAGSHHAACEYDALLTLAGFPDQASRDAARALIKADGGARG